jgi:glycerophosphoryl diester phosphodiesterase
VTATGYVSPTGDTRKVNKSGDTMTGELVLPDSAPDTDLTAASRGYTTTSVSNHAAAVDPHGDRAFATSSVSTHTAAADPHADRAYALGQFTPQAQITVDTLLASDPFYVAHRGGGAAMPEHTIAAYDSAIASGIQAIEVSCYTSADGVLFCMHDTTLDRITHNAYTGAHSTWTWAELQQKAKVVSTALLGPGWADQPIPTLREVLDRYLGKVVIFLEAKSNAAVVPTQTMLGTYAGANKSVVWKNYYTSSSFTWAHTNGYKTWAYMDDATTSAQLDAVESGVDYWGVPITAADAQFQMVLSRATFKPVITWPVIRKAQRDRVTAFSYNGHHVQGIMCSEPLYVPRTTPLRTSSAFVRGILSPGDISASVEDPNFALTFDTVNSAVYCPATSGNGVLLGSFCPVQAGATAYKITFDMMFPVLPTGTLHAGLFFGQVSDNKHQFGVANTEACYRMLFRPNAGSLQLYTVAAGATTGTQLATTDTGAVSAGQWVPLEIEVNATQVILRRTDTATVQTTANAFIRGLYFGIHNGSLTDVTTLPKYRSLNVVAI